MRDHENNRKFAMVKVTGIGSAQRSATCPFEHEYMELTDLDTGDKYRYFGEAIRKEREKMAKECGLRPSQLKWDDLKFPISFRVTYERTIEREGREPLKKFHIGYVKVEWKWL